MPAQRRKIAWLIAMTPCWWLAGCAPSDKHAPVDGSVLLDGKPLAQGSILFTPLDGTQGTATGTQIKQGHYDLGAATGPAVGTHRVQIQGVRGSGKMVQNPLAPTGQMLEVFVGAIPARFNTASTLKVEIRQGHNTADFDVQSE